jgi:hypothetical protein
VGKTNMDVAVMAITEGEDTKSKTTSKTLIKDNSQIYPNLSWVVPVCNNNQIYFKTLWKEIHLCLHLSILCQKRLKGLIVERSKSLSIQLL